MEAMRCAETPPVRHRLPADGQRRHHSTGDGPGRATGNDTDSSVTGSHPHAGSSEKSLPGPVKTQPRTPLRRTVDAEVVSKAPNSGTLVPVDLALLHLIVDERRGSWDEAGVQAEVTNGPVTDKPAAWLVLNNNDKIGQLTVWVSGEAEMDWGNWGTPEDGGERHDDLGSADSLRACVTDLERAVGLA